MKKNDKKNSMNSVIISGALCTLLLAAATVIGQIFFEFEFAQTNIVMLYMLAVLLAARFTDGFFFGIIQSILAAVTFNYFFIEPYFSLNVDRFSYIATIIILLTVSVITSMVTSKAKLAAEEAKELEHDTASLLRLTNKIVEAQSMKEIAKIVEEHTGSLVKCDIICAAAEEEDKLCEEDFSKSFLLEEETVFFGGGGDGVILCRLPGWREISELAHERTEWTAWNIEGSD